MKKRIFSLLLIVLIVAVCSSVLAPVAADDNGVIWIYGIGASERVRIDGETKKITVFEVYENE